MAKKKRRKAGRRTTRKKQGNTFPGWVYMLVGLATGLTVAYAVYVNDRKQLAEPVAEAPAKVEREPASTVPVEVEEAPDSGVTFDFYDMLPSLDVEVYEDEQRAPVRTKPQSPPAPVTKQGIYILQAGSFSRLEDANRRKAEMGLLGVRSDIKKGNANGRVVYRVYSDPMEDIAEVNRTSNLLNGAGIEIMLKRISD